MKKKKCLRSLFPDYKCNSHVQLTATPNTLEVWFVFFQQGISLTPALTAKIMWQHEKDKEMDRSAQSGSVMNQSHPRCDKFTYGFSLVELYIRDCQKVLISQIGRSHHVSPCSTCVRLVRVNDLDVSTCGH